VLFARSGCQLHGVGVALPGRPDDSPAVDSRTKATVLLGFTLAAFNLERIRSYRAKHHLDDQGRPLSG
jgi:hypothetical protein